MKLRAAISKAANHAPRDERSPLPCHHGALRTLRPTLRRSGYILMELIIALTIFAIAVLGLTRSLNTSLEVANIMNHDYAVRLGLRSFMEEVKRKSIANMVMTVADPKLDVTYTSTVEPATVTNPSTGEVFSDMYQLTCKATYTASGKEREESVVLYQYQPQAEQDRRKER